MNLYKIAIVVPWFKETLEKDEEFSMFHLEKFLGNHDIIITAPEGLAISKQYQIVRFPKYYFQSIPAYSRLLLSKVFYEEFQAYSHILIYQHDALVFSSDLIPFCQQGYDYIGAPIFKRYSHKPIFSRVGNGGLSLRRVAAFLDVLNSTRYTQKKVPILKELFTTRIPDLDEWPLARLWLKKLRILRAVRMGVEAYTRQYSLNEDLFWSDRAQLFYPDFTIAPIDTALKFSFDKYPRYCFEQNHHQLPFGCHAWVKWDRAFWEPYLLK